MPYPVGLIAVKETRYTLYRGLGEIQCGLQGKRKCHLHQVVNCLIACRYTDYGIPAHVLYKTGHKCCELEEEVFIEQEI